MVNLSLKTGNLVELIADYTANGKKYNKGDIGVISGYTMFFHEVTFQKDGMTLRLMDDEIKNVE